MDIAQMKNNATGKSDKPATAFAQESVRRIGTLADQIYAILSRGLLMGAWEPDARLSVREIARELSVSVTPVREAMARLANEGALANEDGRGFRAIKLDHDSFKEIVRIRLALEPVAAGLAAAHATERVVADLELQNESLAQAITQDKFAAAIQIDIAFHMAIYELSNQPLLVSMIRSLLLRAGPTRRRLSGSYRKSLAGVGHHRRILAALRSNDAEVASAEIDADLRYGSSNILSEL